MHLLLVGCPPFAVPTDNASVVALEDKVMAAHESELLLEAIQSNTVHCLSLIHI